MAGTDRGRPDIATAWAPDGAKMINWRFFQSFAFQQGMQMLYVCLSSSSFPKWHHHTVRAKSPKYTKYRQCGSWYPGDQWGSVQCPVSRQSRVMTRNKDWWPQPRHKPCIPYLRYLRFIVKDPVLFDVSLSYNLIKSAQVIVVLCSFSLITSSSFFRSLTWLNVKYYMIQWFIQDAVQTWVIFQMQNAALLLTGWLFQPWMSTRKIHKEGATNSGTELQLYIRMDQSYILGHLQLN